MTTLTGVQTTALLRGIDQGRVKKAQGFHHIEQHDVRRWLIRIFGFDGWAMTVDDVTLVFEEPRADDNGVPTGKYDVLYRATVTLSIHDPATGAIATTFTDVATGDSQNTPRLGAHDLALKSAVSGALKRAAVNLGDQFGLSLYFDTMEPVVKRLAVITDTLPTGAAIAHEPDPPVVGEIEPDPEPEPTEPPPAPAADEHVEQVAFSLISAARIENPSERTKAVTRIMVTIGKDKLANKMTSYGVTLGILGDRAFNGEETAV